MAQTKAKTTKAKRKSPPASAGQTTHLAAEVKTTLTAAQRRAEELISLIERRKGNITESFYEIGKALQELLKKKLYAALGYGSFEEMLTARAVFGVTQAWKLIEVVSSVSVTRALELGPEKVFALTRYAKATPEPDTAQSLIDSNATIGDKPIKEVSLREITKAAREAKAKAATKKGAKADPAEREAAQTAKQGKSWLKVRGIKAAEIVTRRTKDGYRIRVRMDLSIVEASSLFKS